MGVKDEFLFYPILEFDISGIPDENEYLPILRIDLEVPEEADLNRETVGTPEPEEKIMPEISFAVEKPEIPDADEKPEISDAVEKPRIPDNEETPEKENAIQQPGSDPEDYKRSREYLLKMLETNGRGYPTVKNDDKDKVPDTKYLDKGVGLLPEGEHILYAYYEELGIAPFSKIKVNKKNGWMKLPFFEGTQKILIITENHIIIYDKYEKVIIAKKDIQQPVFIMNKSLLWIAQAQVLLRTDDRILVINLSRVSDAPSFERFKSELETALGFRGIGELTEKTGEITREIREALEDQRKMTEDETADMYRTIEAYKENRLKWIEKPDGTRSFEILDEPLPQEDDGT